MLGNNAKTILIEASQQDPVLPVKCTPRHALCHPGFDRLSDVVASFSPYVAKVEAWMRFVGLPYNKKIALPAQAPRGQVLPNPACIHRSNMWCRPPVSQTSHAWQSACWCGLPDSFMAPGDAVTCPELLKTCGTCPAPQWHCTLNQHLAPLSRICPTSCTSAHVVTQQPGGFHKARMARQ